MAEPARSYFSTGDCMLLRAPPLSCCFSRARSPCSCPAEGFAGSLTLAFGGAIPVARISASCVSLQLWLAIETALYSSKCRIRQGPGPLQRWCDPADDDSFRTGPSDDKAADENLLARQHLFVALLSVPKIIWHSPIIARSALVRQHDYHAGTGASAHSPLELTFQSLLILNIVNLDHSDAGRAIFPGYDDCVESGGECRHGGRPLGIRVGSSRTAS